MAAPVDTAPPTSPPLDPYIRLNAALRDLTRPTELLLMRVDPVLDDQAAELLTEDRATAQLLAERSAHYLAAGQVRQVRRTLVQLLDHQRRARTRRRRIAAMPDIALIPPLLDLLQAETASSSGRGSGGSAGPYRSIIAIAATELLTEIRRTVGHRGGPGLTDAVRTWAELTTADNAVRDADLAEQWAERIRTLLNPRKRWHHPAACPDCGNRTAEVTDDTGQLVRQPAIEFDVENSRARCLRCPARWNGETQLRALASALRADAPLTSRLDDSLVRR